MGKKKQKAEPVLKLEGEFPEELRSIATIISKRYSFDSVIAPGKTGVAYRIVNRVNGHFYCLKTIRPEIKDKGSIEDVRKTFEKEVDILKPIHHRCLPRIYEYDTTKQAQMPWYICTWHPGVTFEAFRKENHRLSIDESAVVVSSIISAFKELHARGRTHCDLHTKNILISRDVLGHGIMIIDLGSGHHESDESAETNYRGEIHFKELEAQAQSGAVVNRADYNSKFKQLDFKALGLLLAAMDRCFFDDCSNVQRSTYREFWERLSQGKLKTWPEVESAFAFVLDPFKSLTEVEKYFLGEDGRTQVIHLPVSRLVSVGSRPLAVINTPVFQRLRGIKQLSFCDWYFPGATHTRFEHSLGVFGLAKSAIEELIQERDFRRNADTDDLKGLLLAALLHDIGHYPFAHVLEQYTASRLPGKEDGAVNARSSVSHSRHTLSLLETDERLKNAILKHWGDAALQRALRILGKGGRLPIFSNLLDSAIDLDKTDYLSRDSFHCGVEFGGLDRQGLLRSLCVVEKGSNIGIRPDGVPIVEAHLILQHEMLSRIYWDEGVRGATCMFHAILAYLVRRDTNKIALLASELKACKDDAEGWDVIDRWISEQKAPVNTTLMKLSETLRTYDFTRLYVAIARYHPNDPLPKKGYSNVHGIIVAPPGSAVSHLPINWQRARALHAALFSQFQRRVSDVHKAEIVVDVPFGKGAHPPILVAVNGREEEITAISHLNPSIFTTPAAYDSPVRVFVHPRLCAEVNDLSALLQEAESQFLDGEVEGAEDDHSD